MSAAEQYQGASKLTDPWWRLNNLYYIKDKQGNKIRFKPNWAQALLYSTMWYLNVVLKARQLGMTTFIQIFMLDRCLFNDNVNAGIVAHTKDDAETFFADKIKFAYDNLPNDLKAILRATSDSTKHLRFSNGSQIRVGTSLRSGTYQYVHISEFGKMCARYPDKAKEVITGTLNTVAPGQFVFIESTAEGRTGEFYDMCQTAIKLAAAINAGDISITKMDYRFFFFPWWKHPDYVLDAAVPIDEKFAKYFDELAKKHDIRLTAKQKNWYVKKAAEQGSEMKQEYPSTAAEAFERMNEVSIFGKQLADARNDNRITRLPIKRGIPVNTFWDTGHDDFTAIWFHQFYEARHHWIYYFQDRLQNLNYYVEQLLEIKEEHRWHYGDHYLPHDIDVTDISEQNNRSRKQVLEDAGLSNIVVVPKIRHLIDGIELVRQDFDTWYFDEEGCAEGLRALEDYEWKWDDVNKTARKVPKDNYARHGADAIRQCAQAFRSKKGRFREQQRKVAGKGGRQYAADNSRQRSVHNPSTDHVV